MGRGKAALPSRRQRWATARERPRWPISRAGGESRCAAGCASAFRIIDLQKKSSSALSVRLEVRLEGLAAPAGPERVAALALFDLDFERRGEAKAWALTASRTVSGPARVQSGRPHLFEEAAARGLGATHETSTPWKPRTSASPPRTTIPASSSWTWTATASSMSPPGPPPRLFLNDGTGHFRDATAGSGLDLLPDIEASGGVAADVDGDGLPDLFLTSHISPCRMLKNLGHGRFRDVTAEWGLAGFSAPLHVGRPLRCRPRRARRPLRRLLRRRAQHRPRLRRLQRRRRPLLSKRRAVRPSRSSSTRPRRRGSATPVGLRGLGLRLRRRRRRRPLRRERLRHQRLLREPLDAGPPSFRGHREGRAARRTKATGWASRGATSTATGGATCTSPLLDALPLGPAGPALADAARAGLVPGAADRGAEHDAPHARRRPLPQRRRDEIRAGGRTAPASPTAGGPGGPSSSTSTERAARTSSS